jgi:ABC-type phosphate transport system substrate-binding protein
MRMTIIRSSLLAAGIAMTSTVALADVVVVVSAKSAAAGLNAEQVSQIFLGKASNFPSGGAAVPVDQAESSPLREEFYTKVAQKNGAQVKAYWSKLIFTGKGQPPKEVASSAEVKKALAENPNAIGYIDKAAVDASVKVVLTP